MLGSISKSETVDKIVYPSRQAQFPYYLYLYERLAAAFGN